MSARAGGGVSNFAGGVTQRTVDVYHIISMKQVTDFLTGFNPAWNDGYCGRSGNILTGIFPTGAAALTGISNNTNIGQIHLYGATGAGLRDMYSLVSPRVRLVRPSRVYVDPFAVWEIEIHMGVNAVGAALANDCGIFFHGNTSVTGYPNDFLNGGGVGNPGQLGFGVSFFGASPRLRFFARKAASGAVTEGTDLPDATSQITPRLNRLKFRIESATPTADAKLTIFHDEAIAIERNFVNAASGGTIPSVENITGPQNWLGAFRPFFRMSNNVAGATAVFFSYWRISAAPTVAAMG